MKDFISTLFACFIICSVAAFFLIGFVNSIWMIIFLAAIFLAILITVISNQESRIEELEQKMEQLINKE